VQTNSRPSHCFAAATVPQVNNIDFESLFNPTFINPPVVQINNQATLDSQVCDFNWPSTATAPQGLTQFSGNYNGVVGVSFTGVPIMTGNSENDADPFYPNPLPAPFYQGTSDFCLGNVNAQTPFYHFYSFSPCMLPSAQKAAVLGSSCGSYGNCNSATSTYMVSGVPHVPTPVGLALDGHIIYSPWKSATDLYGSCDVDVCNGLQVNGVYGYAMTNFHPYTVACWGPGNLSPLSQSCSTNPKACP
jgi:hypothetical protein